MAARALPSDSGFVALVVRWVYRAANTALWGSMPHTARHAAVRSTGRPRFETVVCPWNRPEVLSRGQIPACLTQVLAESYRAGSPVSASIAAAPTAESPGTDAASSA